MHVHMPSLLNPHIHLHASSHALSVMNTLTCVLMQTHIRLHARSHVLSLMNTHVHPQASSHALILMNTHMYLHARSYAPTPNEHSYMHPHACSHASTVMKFIHSHSSPCIHTCTLSYENSHIHILTWLTPCALSNECFCMYSLSTPTTCTSYSHTYAVSLIDIVACSHALSYEPVITAPTCMFTCMLRCILSN